MDAEEPVQCAIICNYTVQLVYVFEKLSVAMLYCVSRLVKGDGEILEEIVTKDRQKQINKVCCHIAV